jgi:hypothetical protein
MIKILCSYLLALFLIIILIEAVVSEKPFDRALRYAIDIRIVCLWVCLVSFVALIIRPEKAINYFRKLFRQKAYDE